MNRPSTYHGRALASPTLRAVNRGSAMELAADNHEHAAVGVIVVGALLLLKFLTDAYGLGVTPDSAAYFSVAENLLRGRGFIQFDGQPMVLWPPLYSILLAVFSLAFTPMTAARLLNGACLAGTILISWSWVRRVFGRAAAVSVAAGVALSSALIMACMAWSEPLFLLLTVAGLSAVDRYRATGEGLNRAAIYAGLAALTRYPGVALILAGAMLVAAGPGSGRWLRDAAVYLFVSLTPLLFWLWRNFAATGMPTGPRYPAQVGLHKALGQAGVAVAGWAPGGPPLVGFILIVAATIIGTAIIILSMQGEKSRFVQSLLLFCIFYGTALVLTSAYVAMDHINLRLISPLYIPTLMLIAGGLYCLPLVWPSRVTRTIMVIGLAVLPPIAAVRVARISREVLHNGPGGYARVELRKSPLIAWLKLNQLPQPVYSNEPGAVYWLAHQPAIMSPATRPFHSPAGPADDPAPLARAVGGAFVFFSLAERRFLDAEELKPWVEMAPIAQFNDGAVYRIEPLRPAPLPSDPVPDDGETADAPEPDQR